MNKNKKVLLGGAATILAGIGIYKYLNAQKNNGHENWTTADIPDLTGKVVIVTGANNGLGIRTPLKGDAAYVGMELQILDNTAPVYAKLKEYQYHGSVYGTIAAKRGFQKPVGEWNEQEIARPFSTSSTAS